ncbi:XRE family transcriptional regulator [Paenibacillus pinisoli]|uniref:XRE family transcriptional regulator n=1 Tax=Paenibacillus pinisoli TaxID=1276110 RepID=A0A3A6PL74_9BACL|nr:helix-turn-helix transcriptional regulator [Paenibacillus pinisoli]RJX40068.1 XRE family transcriptional regulator [Paenibacillus pinisoli]
MRESLAERRRCLNLSHEAVAERANISRAYYSNVEAGRKDPSFKVMKRIADALDSRVDDLFFNYDVPNRNDGQCVIAVH